MGLAVMVIGRLAALALVGGVSYFATRRAVRDASDAQDDKVDQLVEAIEKLVDKLDRESGE